MLWKSFFSTKLMKAGMFCQKLEPTMSVEQKHRRYLNLTGTKKLLLANATAQRASGESVYSTYLLLRIEHDSGCLLQAIKPFFQFCKFKNPKSWDCCCGQSVSKCLKAKLWYLGNFVFLPFCYKVGFILESQPTKLARRVYLILFFLFNFLFKSM